MMQDVLDRLGRELRAELHDLDEQIAAIPGKLDKAEKDKRHGMEMRLILHEHGMRLVKLEDWVAGGDPELPCGHGWEELEVSTLTVGYWCRVCGAVFKQVEADK